MKSSVVTVGSMWILGSKRGGGGLKVIIFSSLYASVKIGNTAPILSSHSMQNLYKSFGSSMKLF